MKKVLNRSVIEQEIKTPVVEISPEQNFNIVVDKDASLGYETKKWLYILSLPLMWTLTIWVAFKKKVLGINPKINTFLFDGLSEPCRQIKEGAGSWRALDIIYNFPFGEEDGIRGRASDFWIGMINAQAVRNRLKLVKRELTKAIREIAGKEKEVRLLSLASGSAQAVIEVVAELKDINIQVTLLDLDPTAIDYSRGLARKHGVEGKFTFIAGSILDNFKRTTNGARPHIIEMIGFLDYRPRDKAIRLVQKIYEFLLPEGKFLTANTSPNPEQHFLEWVIDWPMIYRTPKELGDLIESGGFSLGNYKIICEPLRLHALAICQKVV